MEGLINKFIIVCVWGAAIGGILGFIYGALLASAKYRDLTLRSCSTCKHCCHSEKVYTDDGKLSMDFMTCRLGRGSNCRSGRETDKIYSLVTEKNYCDKWEEKTGDADDRQKS